MLITDNMIATEPKRFEIFGNYFLLQSVPGGVIDVVFWKEGRRLEEELRDAVAGWYAAPMAGFDAIDITSSLTQEVSFHIARGRVGANVLSGQVVVTGVTNNGTHAPSSPAVTNASGVLLAANASRKYLCIQNQDATGNIWVRGDGGVATADADSIKIGPGESWEPLIPPVGAVNAIGDLVANNNVHVIQA